MIILSDLIDTHFHSGTSAKTVQMSKKFGSEKKLVVSYTCHINFFNRLRWKRRSLDLIGAI